MKELYNEFFFIPTNGKIREKVMLTRIITSIAIVVMCLAAMSITAYAYFSHDITSGISTVQAAKFEAKVSINDGAVAVTKAGKTQTATLPAGTNTIHLTKGTSTAKTGFCIVTINSEIKYYTSQIGTDAARNLTDASVAFTVIVPEGKTAKIEILSHWGTCSVYATEKAAMYITDGEGVDLTALTSTVGETDEEEKVDAVPPVTTTVPTTTTKKPETTETPTVSTTTKVPETTTAPPTTTTNPQTETDSDTSNTPSSTTDSEKSDSSDTDAATESKTETDGDASKSSTQDAEPSATT